MKDREKWMQLCELASREQDPKKMIALTAEIIRLLNEKEDRLFHPVAKAEGNTMTADVGDMPTSQRTHDTLESFAPKTAGGLKSN
jgi:hypothetical protein